MDSVKLLLQFIGCEKNEETKEYFFFGNYYSETDILMLGEDWNFLMYVVGKIESMNNGKEGNNFNVTIGASNICKIQDSEGLEPEIIHEGYDKATCVLYACESFVKLYKESLCIKK